MCSREEGLKSYAIGRSGWGHVGSRWTREDNCIWNVVASSWLWVLCPPECSVCSVCVILTWCYPCDVIRVLYGSSHELSWIVWIYKFMLVCSALCRFWEDGPRVVWELFWQSLSNKAACGEPGETGSKVWPPQPLCQCCHLRCDQGIGRRREGRKEGGREEGRRREGWREEGGKEGGREEGGREGRRGEGRREGGRREGREGGRRWVTGRGLKCDE